MTPPHIEIDVDEIVATATSSRERRSTRLARRALAVSGGVTVMWFVYVIVGGHTARVAENWVAALTMAFGSFVAGATPQGGGAVAFPVFTKGLEIPSEVARTFSLAIQTIGMGSAAAAMLVRGQRIEWRALRFALPFAVGGFAIGAIVLSDQSTPFWTSILPGPYVKVGFTILTASMAAVTWLGYRSQLIEVRPTVGTYSIRFLAVLAACATIGGLMSAQVGSGADVLLYLALVVMAGMSPRVGVATSVVLMATVSLVGFVWFGLIDGQISTFTGLDGTVQSVGGVDVSGAGLDAARFDLFGFWIAAVPVVAWGAPLGALVTSRLNDRRLVAAVLALAAAEVITTGIFLEELRTDSTLLAVALGGAATTMVVLALLQHFRIPLLALDRVAPTTIVTRERVDVGPRLGEQFASDQIEEDDPHA